jgi:hypothetical protein
MPSTGFEPAIPASEWPQTHALDRAVTSKQCRRIRIWTELPAPENF